MHSRDGAAHITRFNCLGRALELRAREGAGRGNALGARHLCDLSSCQVSSETSEKLRRTRGIIWNKKGVDGVLLTDV